MGAEDRTSALRVPVVVAIIALSVSRHHPTSRVWIKSRGAKPDYVSRQQAGTWRKVVTYDADDSSAVCGRGITYRETSLVRVVYVTLPTNSTIPGFRRLWPVYGNNQTLPDNRVQIVYLLVPLSVSGIWSHLAQSVTGNLLPLEG